VRKFGEQLWPRSLSAITVAHPLVVVTLRIGQHQPAALPPRLVRRIEVKGEGMALGVLRSDDASWLDVPVFVDLDQLYGPAPGDVKPWPGGNLVHGLVLIGKVPGRLRQWGRAVDGRWMGLVDFTVCDHHGATAARMERVVVPAEALSEMEMPPQR
jgi:hypothetical protein